ncbi:MAG: GGDEF domain-containing protein, partial [Deefgea sp.]
EHAFIDPLTGLFNRRGFEQIEAKLLSEEHRSLGFISIDLDDFKFANDICGHDFGDTILSDVATLMNDNVRDSDYTIRFGGDELAVILKESTPEITGVVSEKIRAAIFDADMKIGDSGRKITASIGATVIHRNEKDFDKAIKRADKAMYESKAKGKNCVSFI